MKKLNKHECRKFGIQRLRLSPDNGLLHAAPVEWLVSTAVKIIDHRRVLVLYIYEREQTEQGDLNPKWALFQTRDDYITLEHRNNGTTAWRTSSFARLSDPWDFVSCCAFVSLADEQRVVSYFRDTSRSGFSCLSSHQETIQAHRRAKREREKARKIARRMRTVPAIPRGLKEWVRRQVMPAYFFYDYQKGHKTTSGVCSACGQEITLTGVKHNAKAICPHCGRELTMKSRGRMGNLMDRETCQVIQKTAPNELVIRIFKIYYDHKRLEHAYWEADRQFIRQEANGSLSNEDYYENYGTWKEGLRPTFSYYQNNFAADDCGHVYCGNLPNALKGTPWQYSTVAAYYQHFRERMQVHTYLAAEMRHPRLEHLVKTGFFNLASDLAYRGDRMHPLDETQNRTHQILGVAAEDIPFLRRLDTDMNTLRMYKPYRNLIDRQALLLWQLKNDVQRDIPQILQNITPHKMMKYLEKQRSCSDPQAQNRYRQMQALVSEYWDYLDMCGKMGYDLSSNSVLFPKALWKAHDKVATQLKIKTDAEMRRNFHAAYENTAHLDFEDSGLKIVYPATPEDLAREGQALHHCIGTYADRVARKECLILFLRHSDDISTPFYTVELRNRKAVQVRGMENADPTPEVQHFVAAWEQNVLHAA